MPDPRAMPTHLSQADAGQNSDSLLVQEGYKGRVYKCTFAVGVICAMQQPPDIHEDLSVTFPFLSPICWSEKKSIIQRASGR